MRKFKQAFRVFLAVTFAAGMWAGQAGAQNTNLDELGALLVLPIITGGHPGDMVLMGGQTAVTLNTITNASSSNILLVIDMISGDPGDQWGSTSFTCQLTGNETTTFVIQSTGGNNASVAVECSFGPNPTAVPTFLNTGFNNGIMVVAVGNPVTGAITESDVMFGDSIVVDTVGGQAYSFGGIPFQGGTGPGNSDKVYKFDNVEYAAFPSALTTNFITPSAISGAITAELILFTLDGTLGQTNTSPRARVTGDAFNDDEQSVDFQYEFDCFDIVKLNDVNGNIVNAFPGPGLGSLSGHLQLAIGSTATQNDVHDDIYGDGNDSRKRAVHGWIVQNVAGNNPILVRGAPFPQPIPQRVNNITVGSAPAAWGRPLQQSTTALVPLGTDVVTLDAE